MSEVFEFEYDEFEEMLIVNHQEGFSYRMYDEDDVYSVAVKLNEQNKLIQNLKEENEQLRKQMQNYKRLISNSYVGEEETLDGWVGKYVIWETELQKVDDYL